MFFNKLELQNKIEKSLPTPLIGELAAAELAAAKQASRITSRYIADRMIQLGPQDIRLMAGEMTAQEMRTVRAILKGLAANLRG